MTTHTETARTVALETSDTAVLATVSARQGDLVLERVGDLPDDFQPQDTHALLAAGSHGEHRFLGRAEWRNTEALLLVEDGVVVHTDVPDARHGSVRLAPGTWRYANMQELSTDNVVRQVID